MLCLQPSLITYGVFFIGSSREPKVGIIIGAVGAVVLLLPCGMLVFLYKGRRKGYRREVFVDVTGLCHVADEFF